MDIAQKLADAQKRRDQFVEAVNREAAVHNAVLALLQEMVDEQETERLEAERLAAQSWVEDRSDARPRMTFDAAGDVSESVS